MPTIKQFQNSDGTYNGVALMSAVTGLSQAEIKWTFDRVKYLKQVEGKSKAEIAAILREECRATPWESR